MSDNEESRSSLIEDLDKENQNNEETNDFAKSLEEISKVDNLSIINKISQTLSQTSTTNNTIRNFKKNKRIYISIFK